MNGKTGPSVAPRRSRSASSAGKELAAAVAMLTAPKETAIAPRPSRGPYGLMRSTIGSASSAYGRKYREEIIPNCRSLTDRSRITPSAARLMFRFSTALME